MIGNYSGVVRDGMMMAVFVAAIPLFAVRADDGRSLIVKRREQSDQPVQQPEVLPLGHPVRVDRLRPIHELQLLPEARREVQPRDYATERFEQEAALWQQSGTCRLWGDSTYAWEAPALCHRPLYFEDVNLERYGRSHGIAQPAISAVHFGGRFAVWPYMMGAFPPHECIYTLGRTPPGTYAPYHFYRPPLSARGAVYQAGAVSGLAYIVP